MAKQAPIDDAAGDPGGGARSIYEAAMGVDGVTLPPDPIQQQPTYEAALAAFEAAAAGPDRCSTTAPAARPGQPYPGFEHSFDRASRCPARRAARGTLAAGGALSDERPARGRRRLVHAGTPKARPPTNFTGDTGRGDGGLWTATPDYNWQQPPTGTAASYVTEPLGEDTTVVGAGLVEAWVRSSKPNVDLQATITEVRPDGKETFVQGGWLRATMRKLDAKKSTPLEPVLSLRKRDVEPLPRERFAKVTIPLYYQGHAYRAGSRIRVTITRARRRPADLGVRRGEARRAPRRSRSRTSRSSPSSLTLPVVPGVDVPTELPPCPGLRGQPCRDYAADREPQGLSPVGAGGRRFKSRLPEVMGRGLSATLDASGNAILRAEPSRDAAAGGVGRYLRCSVSRIAALVVRLPRVLLAGESGSAGVRRCADCEAALGEQEQRRRGSACAWTVPVG